MLQIIVNGQQLALYSDTTLNIELNNAIFNSDTIDGDICYAFDIPIRGNELALQYSHSAYISGARTFSCLLLIDGLAIIAGKLIVRQSDYDTFSADIVCNPYPDGWPKQSVRKDFTETVIVGTDYATHQRKWKEYLLATTAATADIKFGLHRNEKNYGSDNEFFGNWNGSIQKKLVNRLYLKSNGTIADELSIPFIRLFNKLNVIQGDENTTVDMNQFCFCPQIRLRKALRQVLESAGYNVDGTFFTDSTLNNVFLQSMVALDGDTTQYFSEDETIYMDADYNDDEDPRFNTRIFIYKDTNRGGNYYYRADANVALESYPFGQQLIGHTISTGILWGNYGSSVNIIPFHSSKNVNVNCLNGNITFTNAGSYNISADVQLPRFVDSSGSNFYVKLMLCKGMVNSTSDDSNIVISVSKTIAYNFEDRNILLTGTFNVENSDLNSTYTMKAVYLDYSNYYRSLPAQGTLSIRFVSNVDNAPLNIFAKSFEVNKCLPDLTNSEFVNAIRKAFGLTFYIDALQKRVEVDTVKDILSAQAIDLSNYLLNRETEFAFEEKQVTFRYGGLDSTEEIDADKLLDSVATLDDLPDAQTNVGKICFVTEMNAYYVSEKQDSETDNWAYTWNLYCGSISELSVGSGESEQLKSDAVVPYLCQYESKDDFGTLSVIPDIPLDIESKMFNDTISDKLVLLYYRGTQNLRYRRTTYHFELMTPVLTGSESLTTASIGTEYVLPWMKIYDSARVLTYKFRIPMVKMIEVARLLQPQQESVANQTRWLVVDNIRSMPRKISFQIDNNDGQILCEIEAAVPD